MLPWALQLALLSFAQFHSSSGGDNEPGILLGPAATRNYSIISQAEAVKLMLLGLRDADAIACITHGFKRNSAAAAPQLNPVDAVFRMAADMSGCFTSSRALVSASLPDATAEARAVTETKAAAEVKAPIFLSFRNVAVGAAIGTFVLCAISFFKRRRQ